VRRLWEWHGGCCLVGRLLSVTVLVDWEDFGS